jgi:hypothetical protein
MSSVKLEWKSAEVADAKLTVGLEGDPPKGWKESFERTVTLLGDGDWGEIELKKRTVRVSDITPGSEDKLRHHLEAVVAQANAAHDEQGDEDGGGGDDEKKPDGPDAEMTGRFRAFADSEGDDAEEKGA